MRVHPLVAESIIRMHGELVADEGVEAVDVTTCRSRALIHHARVAAERGPLLLALARA